MHFPLFLYLISLQLILITFSSPLSKVKQLKWRLYLDGCPLASFTQFFSSFFCIFSQYSHSGGTLAAASPRTVSAAASVQLLIKWRHNGGRACIGTMRPPFRHYADKRQPKPKIRRASITAPPPLCRQCSAGSQVTAFLQGLTSEN